MAARSNGQDMAEIREEEREHGRLDANTSEGQAMAQEQLRDLLHNPEVIETLLEADIDFDKGQTDKSWIPELTEEYLHSDQVLAVKDDRDLWERKWTNPNLGDMVVMSFPHPESQSHSERVRRVRDRIRGDDNDPLSAKQRQKIHNQLGERKTDREQRASDGKFLELLLSQVVKSQHSTADNGQQSLWDQLTGGK